MVVGPGRPVMLRVVVLVGAAVQPLRPEVAAAAPMRGRQLRKEQQQAEGAGLQEPGTRRNKGLPRRKVRPPRRVTRRRRWPVLE